jgi:hypothetical protein
MRQFRPWHDIIRDRSASVLIGNFQIELIRSQN